MNVYHRIQDGDPDPILALDESLRRATPKRALILLGALAAIAVTFWVMSGSVSEKNEEKFRDLVSNGALVDHGWLPALEFKDSPMTMTANDIGFTEVTCRLPDGKPVVAVVHFGTLLSERTEFQVGKHELLYSGATRCEARIVGRPLPDGSLIHYVAGLRRAPENLASR